MILDKRKYTPLQRDAGRWVIIEKRKLSEIREAEVNPLQRDADRWVIIEKRELSDIREAEVVPTCKETTQAGG